MQNETIPQKLYKYRVFSINTIKLFESGKVYYSKPSAFNDPLDCNPTIFVDIDLEMLEKLLFKLLVDEKGRDYADQTISELRYLSTEVGDYEKNQDARVYYKSLISLRIKKIIFYEFNDYGVFSLSKKWDCPLMWSHYADEHRGLCIEFDTSDFEHNWMKSVNYSAPRGIKTSDVYEWKINKSSESKTIIQETFFFSKADKWSYEKEWRDINSDSGLLHSQFKITAVHFGLRSDTAIIAAIVNLFSNCHKGIQFYHIHASDDSFKLSRRSFDHYDFHSIRVKESPFFTFKDVIIKE